MMVFGSKTREESALKPLQLPEVSSLMMYKDLTFFPFA